jgi:hypothetical protein
LSVEATLHYFHKPSGGRLQSISGGLPEITVEELPARDLEDLVICKIKQRRLFGVCLNG